MAKDRSGAASFKITAELSPRDVRRLEAAIKRVGPAAQKEFKKQLRQVGNLIRQEIRGRTPRGPSKRLRGGTQVGIPRGQLLAVEVYNKVTKKSAKYPGGYRYGKRLEFDPRFGYNGATGSSKYAFFYPGYEAAKERAVKMFESVLTAARKAFLK